MFTARQARTRWWRDASEGGWIEARRQRLTSAGIGCLAWDAVEVNTPACRFIDDVCRRVRGGRGWWAEVALCRLLREWRNLWVRRSWRWKLHVLQGVFDFEVVYGVEGEISQ